MDKKLLGSRVRDKVTGFTGIVVVQSEHISGCDTVTIQPECKTDANNEVKDSRTVDITRIEVLDDKVVTLDNKPKAGACEIGARL